MNTLLNLHQKPICTSIPSSWNQKNQPLCSSTILHHLQFTTTSWKVHAQAKGFGGVPHHLQFTTTSWKVHAQAKGFGGGQPPNPIQKKDNVPNPGSSQEEDDDKIEPIVFERMMKRILTSVGLPMAFGVVLFKLFDILKANQIWDVPIWVPFITTFVFLGSSVLGVAYGSLSTSWDPEKKGSLLGFEEVKYNWDEMWKEDENKK